MVYNSDSILPVKTLADLEDLPLVVISKNLKITFCNEVLLKRFYLTSESAIGKDVTEIFDGFTVLLDSIKSAIQTNQPNKLANVIVINKITASFDLMLIPSGDELSILIKRSSLQNAVSAQLINKKEMLGNLIANICNNFNNILGAINGNSSILRSSTESLKDKNAINEFATYLDLIDKSVGKAADLISQLSSFSAKVNISFKEVDLNEVIKSLYMEYLSKLNTSIIIDAEILSTKSMVRIDPSLILTSLRDICENAVHAMTIMREPENSNAGGTLTLTIDHIETDKIYRTLHPKAVRPSYWCITIADTGVGIKKDLLKKVCTPFFTEGKSSLNPDGLGLSVANNIIQEHGGFLEIDSEVGQWTKVHFFIPEYRVYELKKEKLDLHDSLLKGNDSTLIATMATALKTPAKASLVLIVDDDIIMRRVAEVVLEKSGYKVLVASDGDEAVNIYKERHNSIAGVFLDNNMPNMSGTEAFYEMKKINPDVKALLISGYDGDSDDVKKALADGMYGFIKKPYTMIDLNRKAKELLGAP